VYCTAACAAGPRFRPAPRRFGMLPTPAPMGFVCRRRARWQRVSPVLRRTAHL